MFPAVSFVLFTPVFTRDRFCSKETSVEEVLAVSGEVQACEAHKDESVMACCGGGIRLVLTIDDFAIAFNRVSSATAFSSEGKESWHLRHKTEGKESSGTGSATSSNLLILGARFLSLPMLLKRAADFLVETSSLHKRHSL